MRKRSQALLFRIAWQGLGEPYLNCQNAPGETDKQHAEEHVLQFSITTRKRLFWASLSCNRNHPARHVSNWRLVSGWLQLFVKAVGVIATISKRTTALKMILAQLGLPVRICLPSQVRLTEFQMKRFWK